MGNSGAKRSKLASVKGATFLAAGSILLVPAFTTGIECWRFIHSAQVANGLVIALNSGGSHPQVRFTDSSGRVIEYPQGGFIFGYHVGDRVKVFYRPEHPELEHSVDSFGALWSFPASLLLLAAVVIAIVFQLIRHRI
jgi:hypothetical protein